MKSIKISAIAAAVWLVPASGRCEGNSAWQTLQDGMSAQVEIVDAPPIKAAEAVSLDANKPQVCEPTLGQLAQTVENILQGIKNLKKRDVACDYYGNCTTLEWYLRADHVDAMVQSILPGVKSAIESGDLATAERLVRSFEGIHQIGTMYYGQKLSVYSWREVNGFASAALKAIEAKKPKKRWWPFGS